MSSAVEMRQGEVLSIMATFPIRMASNRVFVSSAETLAARAVHYR